MQIRVPIRGLALAVLGLVACQRIHEEEEDQTQPPGRESLDVTFDERLEPALLARARFGGEFLPQFARVPGRSGVEKLLHVRGKNLRDILGPGTFDADAVARAARAVVLANADLLWLEPGSGTLVFDGVRFADTSAHAAWRQVATLADGSRVPVEGSVLSVNFDARGNVAFVLRCVWDGVDGLAPAALDVEEAKARVLAELTSVPLVMRREGGTGREQDLRSARTRTPRPASKCSHSPAPPRWAAFGSSSRTTATST